MINDTNVTNENTSNHPTSDRFALPVPIGKDSKGDTFVQNMAEVPHLLVVGCSGSGKTAFIESMLATMVSSHSPKEVRLMIYSSKPSDYILFKDIPHLILPTTSNQECFLRALQWVHHESSMRLRAFSEKSVNNLESYNKRSESPFSQLFIVIDDYYDLVQYRDISIVETIKCILKDGRQVGVHLIVATSMPSAKMLQKDVLCGFTYRVCFAVANIADSRFVLDQTSAVDLELPGEMIFKNYSAIHKYRATYMDEDMLLEAVSAIKSKYLRDDNAFSDNPPESFINRYYARSQRDSQVQNETIQVETTGNYDEYLYPAVEAVLETGICSVSMLQRRVKLGYSRAARLVDQMEELGIVGPYEGARPRAILIDHDGWERLKEVLRCPNTETDFELIDDDKESENKLKQEGNTDTNSIAKDIEASNESVKAQTNNRPFSVIYENKAGFHRTQEKTIKRAKHNRTLPIVCSVLVLLLVSSCIASISKSGRDQHSQSTETSPTITTEQKILESGQAAILDELNCSIKNMMFARHNGNLKYMDMADEGFVNCAVYVDINNETSHSVSLKEYDAILICDGIRYNQITWEDSEFLFFTQSILPKESLVNKVIDFQIPKDQQNSNSEMILSIISPSGEQVTWKLR